jgi:hypothetical protein
MLDFLLWPAKVCANILLLHGTSLCLPRNASLDASRNKTFAHTFAGQSKNPALFLKYYSHIKNLLKKISVCIVMLAT